MARIRNKDLCDHIPEAVDIIKDIRKAIDSAHVTSEDSNDFMGDYLAPLGFREHIYASGVPIWINTKRGLIVKNPFFVSDYAPEFRTPTIFYRDYVIQRKVGRLDLRNALRLLRNMLNPTVYDLHRGNVGWLSGQPVLHDW
jgi:hypothetical protein